jgi:hypothetical protein
MTTKLYHVGGSCMAELHWELKKKFDLLSFRYQESFERYKEIKLVVESPRISKIDGTPKGNHVSDLSDKMVLLEKYRDVLSRRHKELEEHKQVIEMALAKVMDSAGKEVMRGILYEQGIRDRKTWVSNIDLGGRDFYKVYYEARNQFNRVES